MVNVNARAQDTPSHTKIQTDFIEVKSEKENNKANGTNDSFKHNYQALFTIMKVQLLSCFPNQQLVSTK